MNRTAFAQLRFRLLGLLVAIAALSVGCDDGRHSKYPTNGGSGSGMCCDPADACFAAKAENQATFVEECSATGGHMTGWCDGKISEVLAAQGDLVCLG